MRKCYVVVLILLLGLTFAFPVAAQEKATKEEVVAKCKEAAQMVKDKGLEETLMVIADKNGPFVWKDTYVFAIDTEKECNVAHPIRPSLVGKNLMGVKDENGKLF